MLRPIPGLVVAAFVLVSIAPFGASSELYRYTDSGGELHVVSDLSMVPPEYREAATSDARVRKRGDGVVNVIEDGEATAASGPPPASQPAPSQASGSKQMEDWWRLQAQEKRRAVDNAQAALSAAEREDEEDITSDTLEPVRVAGKGRHKPRRGRRHGGYYDDDDDDEGPSIEQLQGEVDRAERDLSDFEERARKSSVPPGWLR